MSKVSQFFSSIGRGFKKIGEKVGETYDAAAAALREKRLEYALEEQYENLGRLVYRDLHTDEDLEDMKLEIIANIDVLFDELEILKAQRAARRARKPEACEEDVTEEEDVGEDAACDLENCEEPEEEKSDKA